MNFICLKYPGRTTSTITILINAESEECVLFCFKSDMLKSYITDLRDDKKLAQFNKKTKKHCKSIHSKKYVPSLHTCCVVIVLWCSGREPNTYLNEVNWGKNSP